MILTTHGYVGASIFQLFSFCPPLGLFLAFLSHFGLDFLPHWDYGLNSLKKDRESGEINIVKSFWPVVIVDISKIIADFFFGLLLVFIFWQIIGYEISLLVFIAYFLACLPDFNQLINFLLNLNKRLNVFLVFLRKLVIILHSFHELAHSRRRFCHKKGIFYQALIIVFISFLLVLLK